MRVLFAISEADPFIKTGGLGEVGGSLPFALQKLGIDVRVILPKYQAIPNHFKEEMKLIQEFNVPLAWRNQYCGLQEMIYKGIPFYFIDNEYYFKRANAYGEFDEAEQFAFFCRAVLESIRYMPEFKPDIIHCHDWHTALIPLYLKEFYAWDSRYFNIKTIFTIHNLKYQGIYSKEVLGDILGLNDAFFTSEKLEFHQAINFMKAGLVYANRITTVSPTYAKEIQYPYYGEGLEGVFLQRSDQLRGILNGINKEKYDPYQDSSLFVPYHDFVQGKEENKKQLQHFFGLPARSDVPLLSIVSRLVAQKGLDLVAHVLEEILALDVQMVVLGTGEKKYEEMFCCFAGRYPHKLVARIEFNDELARKIYAGTDLFLMPSQFEPCGIAQIIAMRYGAVPLVRETGGLKDTVSSYEVDSEQGNGFSFLNYNAHEFLFTLQRAVRLYREDPFTWRKIQANAGLCDFGWEQSALDYLEVYESLYYR